MLTKITKYSFIAFIAIYLLGKSFYQYFIMDILAQYSVYTLIVAFVLCLMYNILARKEKNKSILLLLPIIIIPYVLYTETSTFYFGKNNKNEVPNFKIISINIFSGNAEYESLENYLKQENSDVLVLQELTPDWQKNIEFVRKNYPYFKEEVRTNNFGIGIYSKVPLDTVITKNYIDEMHPSLIANLSVKNNSVTILATHPVPPIPNQERFERRNKQYTLLKKDIDSIENKNIIFIGDLNSTVFSPNFKLVQSDKLKDARSGFGMQNSWNAFVPLFRTNIDQCWVSRDIKVTNFYRGENIKSDHFPIIAELIL